MELADVVTIVLETRGGVVARAPRRSVLDVAKLDAAGRQQLGDALARIDPAALSSPGIRGADQQQYELTLELRHGRIVLQAADGGSPPELLELIDTVGELA